MNNQTYIRWGIYGFIIVAVLLILWVIQPAVTYTPHGLFLPTQKQLYSAQSETAPLYRQAPMGMQVIGNISVSDHPNGHPELQQKQMIAYAQQLATQHGAKGLVPVNFFRSQGDGPLSVFLLQAQAVR
tara:strand:+ start:46057 stop:46440 length:384 start_codon:yes stop_codon:yes gene_type:complete